MKALVALVLVVFVVGACSPTRDPTATAAPTATPRPTATPSPEMTFREARALAQEFALASVGEAFQSRAEELMAEASWGVRWDWMNGNWLVNGNSALFRVDDKTGIVTWDSPGPFLTEVTIFRPPQGLNGELVSSGSGEP